MYSNKQLWGSKKYEIKLFAYIQWLKHDQNHDSYIGNTLHSMIVVYYIYIVFTNKDTLINICLCLTIQKEKWFHNFQLYMFKATQQIKSSILNLPYFAEQKSCWSTLGNQLHESQRTRKRQSVRTQSMAAIFLWIVVYTCCCFSGLYPQFR